MGATSATGTGEGSVEKTPFPGHLHAGCGTKGPKPQPCGPYSCAFAIDFHKKCGCKEEKVQRGCAIRHKVGSGPTKTKAGQGIRHRICG